MIALAAASGLSAPGDRRADNIAVDGRLLRFSDGRSGDLFADPNNAPSFASINNVAGTLLAVPGYVTASTNAGVPFGYAASGIRPDTLDYPGLDAFVLVDSLDVERYRPQAGTDGAMALSVHDTRRARRPGRWLQPL